MKTLTEAEFDAKFTVVQGPDGDDVRPDYNGIEPDSKHLWTITEGGNSLYALTGAHFVNRIGYIVTEEAWDEDTEAVWYEGAESEDDEEDDEEWGDDTDA